MGKIVNITPRLAQKELATLAHSLMRLEGMPLDDLNAALMADCEGKIMKAYEMVAYVANHLCKLSIEMKNYETALQDIHERNEA